MEAEYIDRETVIKNLEKLCDRVCQYSKAQRYVMCSSCPLGDAFTVIEDDIPQADVRPVRRGRWIVRETACEDTEARCSECGFTTLINEPGNGLHMLSDLNYCPGCGSYNGAERGAGEDG